MLLRPEEHHADEHAALEVTMAHEVAEAHPSLCSVASYQSAGNLDVMLHVANGGLEDGGNCVIIPAGTYFADAVEKAPPSLAPTVGDPYEKVVLRLNPALKTMASLPFSEGGCPTTEEEWREVGLDLSLSIDPDRPISEPDVSLVDDDRTQLLAGGYGPQGGTHGEDAQG